MKLTVCTGSTEGWRCDRVENTGDFGQRAERNRWWNQSEGRWCRGGESGGESE